MMYRESAGIGVGLAASPEKAYRETRDASAGLRGAPSGPFGAMNTVFVEVDKLVERLLVLEDRLIGSCPPESDDIGRSQAPGIFGAMELMARTASDRIARAHTVLNRIESHLS